MIDDVARPGDSLDAIRCGVCERNITELLEDESMRALLPLYVKQYHLPPLMCSSCFVEWYDNRVTSREEIKRIVLANTRPVQ